MTFLWHIREVMRHMLTNDVMHSLDTSNSGFRLVSGAVMYGGMTLAGKFLCDAAGVDVSGGFRLDAEDFFSAWLFALVPIFGALVVHQVSFSSMV